MSKTVKLIIWAVIILVIIALLVFSEQLRVQIGAIFAAVAGGFATLKSKLFKSGKTVEDQIADIEEEHAVKREEWQQMKDEYNSRYNALKARMDYLDYRSALISQEIKDLDEIEIQALERNRNLSDEEILRRLRDL